MERAQGIADALVEGFDRHYELFRTTSARAKDAFDAGDWTAVQHFVKERIRFYDDRVVEYAERLSVLPPHHKDPFDRLMIAQALVDGIAVVGVDAAFDAYGVTRIW